RYLLICYLSCVHRSVSTYPSERPKRLTWTIELVSEENAHENTEGEAASHRKNLILPDPVRYHLLPLRYVGRSSRRRQAIGLLHRGFHIRINRLFRCAS